MAGGSAPAPAVHESTYGALRRLVAEKKVTELVIQGMSLGIATTSGEGVFQALLPEPVAADFAREVAAQGVNVAFQPAPFFPVSGGMTAETLLAIGGNLLILGFLGTMFYIYVLKGPLSNRSKATMYEPGDSTVCFADVAGCDAEKHELMEVVEFLRDPGKFARLGGRVPTGVLLSGPPGTGKTLLAKACAGEAGVPFFSISGSDFVEMFVGVGASRVRTMFAKAKKKAPCIVFIDEIDAVGRSRSSGTNGGAHEEREQTLNQLLVEMDGFKPNEGVIIIAATNRPEILDQALLRPGRFSRHIVLQNPDISGREKILAVHVERVLLAEDVSLSAVARGTPGFSGAELANIVNEAAILAARSNRPAVCAQDFDHAKDRLLLGNERRSLVMSDEDRRLTAYHEAGHALVALHSPASDPIHKVTIVPHGRTLGAVIRLPERDTPSWRRSKLEADLAVAMGGRAAEEMIFGADDVSTGASGDIHMASHLARRMVAEWGMSEAVGMITYNLNPQAGGEYGVFSDETSREIDAEVRALVTTARDRALAILGTHNDDLHRLAQALLDREVLTGDEVQAIVRHPLRLAVVG
ncbi:MAG: ATP-dependent zinc metalloprotease FtsH [Rhodospirillales bacterium]|nr:ATP-dependent zinc metalloprotease FtsH [Rhodospirillales bacterium]